MSLQKKYLLVLAMTPIFSAIAIWQGAFPKVAPTAPAIDFGERTMHID
jgi:hypothetical protein